MSVSRNEHTIAESCQVSGRGYWTGQHVRVVISPAPVGTGVQLVRVDLPDQPTCIASTSNRRDTQLRTIVQNGHARFEMVEHLMAALYAMEIDNCRVEIDGEEFPGLDGSSHAYVNALQHAGLIVQASVRRRLVIDRPIRVERGNRWIQATPLSPTKKSGTHFEYRLRFNTDTPIAAQTFSFTCTPSCFAREVSRARTFVTKSQAESLRAQGVAQHVTNQELLVFDEHGPVDNKLRYQDECARHKTLDLIGDLSLTGLDIIGSITSYRGGHSLNGLLAQRLVELAALQGMMGPESQSHTNQASSCPFESDRDAA
ncbi:MAG: UDP-3-O-[3-hydroxymyristoyl] N-acetylglucosamine deacetylase [Pirellulaceae bacterium]|nr:UDP-3-O-[3-hydroxymyristoyl] N-acetylglucosamine deacetylase [Pirellulaceae bacterium]